MLKIHFTKWCLQCKICNVLPQGGSTRPTAALLQEAPCSLPSSAPSGDVCIEIHPRSQFLQVELGEECFPFRSRGKRSKTRTWFPLGRLTGQYGAFVGIRYFTEGWILGNPSKRSMGLQKYGQWVKIRYCEKWRAPARSGGTCLQAQHLWGRGRSLASLRPVWDEIMSQKIKWNYPSSIIKVNVLYPTAACSAKSQICFPTCKWATQLSPLGTLTFPLLFSSHMLPPDLLKSMTNA